MNQVISQEVCRVADQRATWKGEKAVRGEKVLHAEIDGFDVRLYDTGSLYTLRISYWAGDRDASREGFTHDSRYCGKDWETIKERAAKRGVKVATFAAIESEADENEVELR